MNKELLDSQFQQDSLDFSWSGNLGHWYWDFPANKVTFNPMKAQAHGYTKEELPESVNFQFFTDKLHPEDYERVMEVMRQHLRGDLPVWEVKYRIRTKSGEYKTYYDRGKVTQRAADGSPLFLSGIVFDISENEEEKERLLAKNEEWEYRSRLDQLTGLYNRSNILFLLGKMIKVSETTSDPLSMILLDIDKLDHQNKLFGELFGDEMIQKASKVILKYLSSDEEAGYFEGGKFLIRLPNKKKEDATKLVEKIQNEIHTLEYSKPAEVTIISGVASYQLYDTVSQFYSRTEHVLQKAKKRK